MLLVTPFFIPGMAESIDSSVDVGNIFWLYCPGFIVPYVLGGALYYAFNLARPAKQALVEETIWPEQMHIDQDSAKGAKEDHDSV